MLSLEEIARGYPRDPVVTQVVRSDLRFWRHCALNGLASDVWATVLLAHVWDDDEPVASSVLADAIAQARALAPAVMVADLMAKREAGGSEAHGLARVCEAALVAHATDPHHVLACCHFARLLHRLRAHLTPGLAVAFADALHATTDLAEPSSFAAFVSIDATGKAPVYMDQRSAAEVLAEALRGWAKTLGGRAGDDDDETCTARLHTLAQLYNHVRTPLSHAASVCADAMCFLLSPGLRWTLPMLRTAQAVLAQGYGEWVLFTAGAYEATGAHPALTERALLAFHAWAALCRRHAVPDWSPAGERTPAWLAVLIGTLTRAVYHDSLGVHNACCLTLASLWHTFVDSAECRALLPSAVGAFCGASLHVDRDPGATAATQCLLGAIARHMDSVPMRECVPPFVAAAARALCTMPSSTCDLGRLAASTRLLARVLESKVPRIAALLAQAQVHLAIGTALSLIADDPQAARQTRRLETALRTMATDTDARRWLAADRFDYPCSPLSRTCVICLDDRATKLPMYICPACTKEIGHPRCVVAWVQDAYTCPLCRARV